ncbi:uncharacterized protein LOC127136166 [Lathyrus oleraceus]|uniref:uncharacterized protein LOC127136166 n=1 Tax=Pisum sativum TaxID=3888 RepID=UPI0021D0EE4C|nr:uncharacterized protein LOC127136166 [Pisum sativum]
MVHGDSEDSDHLYTPPGSDDEDEGMKYPTYKSSQGMKFQLRMLFTNKEMIRDVVKDYVMENQKNVFIKKNDSKRIVVKCTDGCKFYMRFSKRISNQFWQVVTLIEDHTCHRTVENKSAKTKWLINKFSSILRHSPYMKPSSLRVEVVKRWGVKLIHDQVYRAKRKAMELVAVMETMCLKEFVCLEACKTGFAKTCRPLIGLDACFLKRDYGGKLMAAVGRDGNNQNFPISYVVVEAETKDSWQWFLSLLMPDLEGYSQRSYAFISYQQKGLVPVVQGISANMECILCVKHLYGNWKKKHPGLELKEVLWAAARAIIVPAWEREILRMKAMKEDAWKDMLDVPAFHWSRSHFRTYSKNDLQVNNMSEAFNKEILEHMEKPIITLLEGIKHYITKRMTRNLHLWTLTQTLCIQPMDHNCGIIGYINVHFGYVNVHFDSIDSIQYINVHFDSIFNISDNIISTL